VITLNYEVVAVSETRLRAKAELTNQSIALTLGRFAIVGVHFSDTFRRKPRSEIPHRKRRVIKGGAGNDELLVSNSSLDMSVVSIARILSDNCEDLV
jgi:hypothetical protein